MLELDLKEMGNNGSFNFMLNSPIEYPNALVETLFISNPEDEMKIMDEKFQQQMADKIVQGIKDFLEAVKKISSKDRPRITRIVFLHSCKSV